MNLILSIKKQLLMPLPGKKIQYQMAPENRKKNFNGKDTLPKNGSVLILLFEKNNEFFFLLMERADNLKFHSGQISFPGGTYEDTDKNMENTALRETYEETGCLIQQNKILGKLTPLYIPISNFMVSPFVAFSPETPRWQKNNSEVKSLIEVNLIEFLKSKSLNFEKTIDGKNIKTPYFLIRNKMVWGATAMILNEFKFVLNQLPLMGPV